jgi:hypothetical protein
MNPMLKEFAELLVGLGKSQKVGTVTNIPGVDNAAFLHNPDGTLQTIELPVPPRGHKVRGLEDIIDAVATWKATEDDAVIWINPNAVLLVLDDDDRRKNIIACPLETHPQFDTVAALGKRAYDNKSLIRILRFDLKGCWTHSDLISQLHRVEWGTNTKTAQVAERSRESMGRSIDAAVSNLDKLPEELIVRLPVFRTHGAKFFSNVNCSIEPDLGNQVFRFEPFPAEIDNAIDDALHQIEDALSETKLPILFGTP